MAKTPKSSAAKTPKPELATPTDLTANSTMTVADALNGILADSFALYLKTKNFHWHVSGPHFRDYHLMLDDQASVPGSCSRPAATPERLLYRHAALQPHGTPGATRRSDCFWWRAVMLKWALIFLVVGLVLGAMGFGGLGGAFVGVAKLLFFVAIAIFVIFLVLALMAGRKVV